jgi:hypothetical protein
MKIQHLAEKVVYFSFAHASVLCKIESAKGSVIEVYSGGAIFNP